MVWSNLSPGNLVILAGIALVVFGPKKLPEIGRTLGSALREINKMRNDFMETINSEMHDVQHEVKRYVDEDADEAHSTPALASVPTPPNTYAGPRPTERRLEYPEPLQAESADALPFGGDFHAEGDSQPAFRTAHGEGPHSA